MKKALIFLFVLVVLAVSCSSPHEPEYEYFYYSAMAEKRCKSQHGDILRVNGKPYTILTSSPEYLVHYSYDDVILVEIAKPRTATITIIKYPYNGE